MLEIEGLEVSFQGKRILGDVNLRVGKGHTAALFGPNGSGKTSLLKTIIGVPGYEIVSGKIVFKGEDVTSMAMDQRARAGIGMAFQRPPSVRGVSLRDIITMCPRKGSQEARLADAVQKLNLTDFLDRDVNLGFSGGEIKRSELLQLEAQDPDLILLDEPDSGVDLVSITAVAGVINHLLEKDKRADMRTRSGLIITHAGHILDYVNADTAHIMLGGTIHCSGNPRDLLEDIREKGYEGCVKCCRQM